MAPRRLDARPLDAPALVRIVRAALAREIVHVALVEPAREDGVHVLRLPMLGDGGVALSLAAEPAGAATEAGQPLRLAPLDEAHTSELRAWVDDDDIVPLSRRSSAIFDSSPPLPSSDEGLGGSVLFDPDAVLSSRRHARPIEVEETITLPDAVSRPGPAPSSERSVATQRDFPLGNVGVDASAPTEARPAESFGPHTPTDPIVLSDILSRRPGEEPLAPSIASVRTPRARRAGPASLARGRTIGGKYEIEALIGSGAVGAVYKASHSELARTVAIKVLHQAYRSDAQLMNAFRTEARAASRLQHPNVTVVHDFGEDPDGLVYIVMEHLEGRTLQTVLDAEGALDAQRAVKIMMQVCGALAAAHEWGVVHRDVKPDNIVLVMTRDDDDGEPREHVKVCDFGIAALESAPRSTPDHEEEFTAGTPEYMAPEQAHGHYDARTDIYACGIVLYEMLTGVVPFTGPSVKATLEAHARLAPQRPSAVDARVTPALEAVVLRAIEKRPDRRFASMRELRAELKRAL